MRNLDVWREAAHRSLVPSASGVLTSIGMPELVEDEAPRRIVRTIGLALSLAVFAGVIWASIARLSEISVAVGTLVPSGFERPVQHYEGGIVERLLVREGDVVKAGAPLVQLRDAATFEDSDTLDHQRADLMAQREAQQALLEDRPAAFDGITGAFEAERVSNLKVYQAAFDAQAAQRRELDSQIAEAGHNLAALRAQRDGATAEVEHAQFEEQRYQGLLQKGVATEVQVAEKKRLTKRAQADLAAVSSRQEAAAARLVEVERQKARFEADRRAGFARRILDLDNALTTLDGTIRKKDGRKDRLTVTAPIDGAVKAIAVRGPGAVVTSGQTLATIVPLDKPLVAETRVMADQIGYLRLGQEARVKVSAFDYSRYGWLLGHVESISPASFQGDTRGSYYVVRIALDTQHPAHAPAATLIPGMDVTADIVTGDKTVLQYTLTPLQRTLGAAFGER
jgi:HlyD family type I secretion membrane fusion protein